MDVKTSDRTWAHRVYLPTPVRFAPYPTVIGRRRVAVRVQMSLPADTNP